MFLTPEQTEKRIMQDVTHAKRIKQELEGARACNCIGPQNGEPRCPCMMRGLIQRNGRWIEPEKDLGPVTSRLTAT